MNRWLALALAFAIAFPLLWYNLKDFLADVDRGYAERDGGWFRRIRLFWQLGYPFSYSCWPMPYYRPQLVSGEEPCSSCARTANAAIGTCRRIRRTR